MLLSCAHHFSKFSFFILLLSLFFSYSQPVAANNCDCKKGWQKKLCRLFTTNTPKKVCIMPAIVMVQAGVANKPFNFSQSRQAKQFIRKISANVSGSYRLLPFNIPKNCKRIGWTQNFNNKVYQKCLLSYRSYKLSTSCDANRTYIIGASIPLKGKPRLRGIHWTFNHPIKRSVIRGNTLSEQAKNFAYAINREVKKQVKQFTCE